MELISCYIENFGKLQAQSFEFSEGLNSVLQKNGFGKTTLATFIKAMFYGLPATTKRDLNENDRKKYTPWQGGAYGGSLCFKINGKSYKVERFFGKKESDDTFVLYDMQTGKQSNDFSENLGLELFGLDANAYEKCTFIPQKEIESGVNESISSKLLGMVNGAENSESLEAALKVLDEKRSEIKKQNKTGKLYDVQNQIDKIEQKIANLKGISPTIETINAQIAENDEKIKKVGEQKEVVSKKISEVAENEKLLANQKYIKENLARKNELLQKKAAFDSVLCGKELQSDDLEQANKKYKEYQNAIAKLDAMKSSIKFDDDFRKQKEQWGNDYPTKDEITKAIEHKQEQNKLSAEVEIIKQSAKSPAAQNQTGKSKVLIGAGLLSAVLIVIGVAMLFVNKTIAIVGFILGFIALIFAGFVYLKNYIALQTSLAKQTGAISDFDVLKQKQEKLAKIEGNLLQFAKKYNIDFELTAASLSSLLAQVNQYEISLAIEKESENKISDMNKSAEHLLEEVDKFLNQFSFAENLQKMEEKFLVLDDICRNYNKISSEIDEINSKLEEFDKKEQPATKDSDLEGFGISKLQQEERTLQHQIDVLKENRAELVNKLAGLQEELVGLDDLKNDLSSLKEEKEELKQQLKIIEKTKEFLQGSNDSLSAKFLAPIKTSLNKYVGKFVNGSELVLSPDINMNITFDKNGASRELAFLSKGYQTVVDLCIRFALVDALFENEKPFLILDDPFVNLDEEKIASAMKLLKSVAKEYQIIYLTCHSARL